MQQRQDIPTEQLQSWYNAKYKEMGGCWRTSEEDCQWHLENMNLGLCIPTDRILDVGYGSGDFAAYLYCELPDTEIIGVDNSVNAWIFARSSHPELKIGRATLLLNHIQYVHRMFGDNYFNIAVSIGTIEHLEDDALEVVREVSETFYFYNPNELWIHTDQPNERTGTDSEWIEYLEDLGYKVTGHKRRNDNTAFWGTC